MTKDIIGKLRDHLAGPVDTECAVVYLLAEVRKILEREKPDPKPFALWMHCHWALHVNLTKTLTTEAFLHRVDDFVTATVHGLTPNGPYTMIDSHDLFREFVYLDTFRAQLREFFETSKLPVELCVNDSKWFKFLEKYALVVQDGELSSQSDKNDGLNAVDKVTFKIGRTPFSSQSHLPFANQWDILLNDGRICRCTLEADPQLKMISHHLELLSAPAVAVSRQSNPSNTAK
jgi:hypothetical protein